MVPETGEPKRAYKIVSLQICALPRDVMDGAYKTAFDLYAEYSGKHPAWAKIYPGWKKFRDESFEWFRVAEYSYDSYRYAAQAAKK